jgi:hypothetical protein
VCEMYTSKCPLLTSSRIVFLINDTNAIWEGIFGSKKEEEEDEEEKEEEDTRWAHQVWLFNIDDR